jgi:hypothetical protein
MGRSGALMGVRSRRQSVHDDSPFTTRGLPAGGWGSRRIRTVLKPRQHNGLANNPSSRLVYNSQSNTCVPSQRSNSLTDIGGEYKNPCAA